MEWSRIEAFEGGTSPEKFYQTVPLEWQPRVKFHYANVTVSRNAWPFVPSVIEEAPEATTMSFSSLILTLAMFRPPL